jgi:hypothetical protein
MGTCAEAIAKNGVNRNMEKAEKIAKVLAVTLVILI